MAAGTYLVLDTIWLSFALAKLYRPAYGALMADKFRAAPIAAFYFIYVLGIVILAVGPALQAGSLLTTTGDGALLGLVAYATYYLTNLGTIRGWPASLTAINVIWGSFSTSISASVAYFAVTHCRIIL